MPFGKSVPKTDSKAINENKTHGNTILLIWAQSPLAARLMHTIAKFYGNFSLGSIDENMIIDFIMKNNIPNDQGPRVHSMNQYLFPASWFDPLNQDCLSDIKNKSNHHENIAAMANYYSYRIENEKNNSLTTELEMIIKYQTSKHYLKGQSLIKF